MTPLKIYAVVNGYIMELGDELYVGKTLQEFAERVGEKPTNPNHTSYTPGYDKTTLQRVFSHMLKGEKIMAIKLLRNCFTPALGLLEAKDLVEQLCQQ